MANSSRYGYFEYGDVYDYDNQSGTRSTYVGKLVVDQDNNRFYLRTEGKAATAIPHDRINWMLANDLIDFYQEDSRAYLIDYMMRLDEHARAIKENERKKLRETRATSSIKENEKLIKTTKSRSRKAKLFWAVGCLAIVGLGVLMSIPTPDPQPVIPSIAGEGTVYPIDADLLTDTTSMVALGNGSELYGIIMDDVIVESGQQNSNESTIKENVLVNASVSMKYPIHMRPLYYDRSSFYQSQVRLNDADQGSSGIMLQNPEGYSLGYARNEIVLFGGRGLSSLVISTPDAYKAESAREVARDIEQKQQEAAREATSGKSNSTKKKDEAIPSSMPDGWNGYDYADIDSHVVVGSYWYTKNSSGKKADLMRRVAVWDISPVLNQGEAGISSLEPIQLNYQDLKSSFYNPVVSMSPSSNGSRYWIGYMKEDSAKNTGFFIRVYETAEDILKESYENTFSTKDLTGSNYPITNYTLHGDRLFFEQQGYIWVIDLSKASITVEGDKRTIKKENPIKICKSSEIRPTVSRDEAFIAQETGETTVPVSHYQVMTITTTGGVVEYGIAFIESDTGDLVFQPVNGATVAAANFNSGSGAESGANNVYSADDAALKEAQEEAAARNGETISEDNSKTSEADKKQSTNSEQNIAQTAYTVIQAAADEKSEKTSDSEDTASKEEGDLDTGRILIKKSTEEIQIVCFTVRGEQFYWIEQRSSDNARRMMISPVYYKNDASQVTSDAIDMGESGEASEETSGIQPNKNAEDGTISTSSDTMIESKKEASYWINFYKEGTKEKIAETKHITKKKVGDKVTEEAVGIGGYKLTSDRKVTITLKDGTNEINFYYKSTKSSSKSSSKTDNKK